MTDKDIEVIVKPIFTKMFKANFSACEYGIECYKKGMEYQGIKELAIENDNLIKRNTKLEQENETLSQNLDDAMSVENCLKKRIAELEYQLTHRNCLDCSNHSSNLRMRNLDLEKENAELKKQLVMSNKVYNDNLDYSHHIEDQLTKAKEIIKTLAGDLSMYSGNYQKELLEAEQFISEVEK